MKTRARRRIAIGLALVALGVVAWLVRSDAREPPRPGAHPARLDADAFRAQAARRLQRAKELAARPANAKPAPAPQRSGKWPMQGLGPFSNSGQSMTTPCLLGPGELCTALADLIVDCDAGDALDCIAVGQFLADTPPRPLVASVFFLQACRIGDASACERFEDLKGPLTVPCERDPFACGWRAQRTVDKALLDQACSLGVADSCAYLIELTKDDVVRSRGYVEAACQLGNPMVCEQLARRLGPNCAASGEPTCYSPDAAQAAAAHAIACGAGWGSDCER